MFFSEKNRFRLVWLINFFNRHQTRLKKHWQRPLSFTQAPSVLISQLVNAEKSGKEYFQELARFNRKWFEKCSIGKPQVLQPKPVTVETVAPNGTRP